MDVHLLDFAGCVFRRVRFEDVRAQIVHFSNCRMEGCDFSGMTFCNGTMTRAEFVGCRATGATIDRTKMQDVLFCDTVERCVTVAGCKLERVEMTGCDLSGAMWLETRLSALQLTRCRLRETEFQATPLRGVDLSDCQLEGLAAAPELLRGATVALDQAPLILGLFGVRVRL